MLLQKMLNGMKNQWIKLLKEKVTLLVLRGKRKSKENANDIYEKEMKAVKKSKKSKIKGE